MEGDEIDECRKRVQPPFDMAMWLRWNLNKDGAPLFPLIVPKKGEDVDSLSSFKAWVAGMPNAKAEPYTPQVSQPTLSPTCDAAMATVPSVDLTDD
ncbi:hypothetical protein SLA2020_039000 [Shorea laevis]